MVEGFIPLLPGVYLMSQLIHHLRFILIFCTLSVIGGFSPAHSQTATDPQDVLAAVVGVRSQVPADARTATMLGSERSGSGVIIDQDGLVLTIGYLILEAQSVELTLSNGATIPAKIVAYDHPSGLGLLRASRPLASKPIRLGEPSELMPGDPILIISRGAQENISPAQVIVRKTFTGTWEYLLDNAIFTSPPHRDFNGAALIGNHGELLGIGSLILQDVLADQPSAEITPGNMFVPVDVLQPVLAELIAQGRRSKARPWLGLYAGEYRGRLFVDRVAQDGPAQTAGIKRNDLIVAVDQQAVNTLSGFLRQVWALGEAGVTVPLTVLREAELVDIPITSGDRYDWLRLNPAL